MMTIEASRQKSPLLRCPALLTARLVGAELQLCILLQNLCPLKPNTPLFWRLSSQDRCKNLKQALRLADRQR